VVQFRHTCEAVHSTVQYGTVTRAVICDSARAGLGPKLSHKSMNAGMYAFAKIVLVSAYTQTHVATVLSNCKKQKDNILKYM